MEFEKAPMLLWIERFIMHDMNLIVSHLSTCLLVRIWITSFDIFVML
jgi:hypothetical protein